MLRPLRLISLTPLLATLLFLLLFTEAFAFAVASLALRRPLIRAPVRRLRNWQVHFLPHLQGVFSFPLGGAAGRPLFTCVVPRPRRAVGRKPLLALPPLRAASRHLQLGVLEARLLEQRQVGGRYRPTTAATTTAFGVVADFLSRRYFALPLSDYALSLPIFVRVRNFVAPSTTLAPAQAGKYHLIFVIVTLSPIVILSY